MKKNISNIKTLAVLFAAGAIVTACTNDVLVDPTTTGKTYTLSVNAVSAGASGNTRALSLDGKTLNAFWSEEETVYVMKDDWIAGELCPSSEGPVTLLTGAVEYMEVGEKIDLLYPRYEIDYSGQIGTLEDIAANYNYAKATATISGFEWNDGDGVISADNGSGGPVVFENQQAIAKFTLVNKADGTPLAASQLTVKVGKAAYVVTPEAPMSELFVAIPGFSSKDVTVSAMVGDEYYTFEQSGVTFVNSQYYAVTVKMTKGDNPYITPLTFEAKTAGAMVEFALSEEASNVEYSTDGITWQPYNLGDIITAENVGDKVSFRADNAMHGRFGPVGNGEWYLYGNIMSIVSATNYTIATELKEGQDFGGMFCGNINIYNHPDKKIMLPATKLIPYCYNYMFLGCKNLTEAPELPATTLAFNCYQQMFQDCTGLITAPELPATTLANECYEQMFQGCTSLTTAPELPATTLTLMCYYKMFQGCTSMTTAPALPATTLESGCYQEMFKGCTGLTTAPTELPATSLNGWCYREMFRDCSSLTTAPRLLATTLDENCCEMMFYGCSSLVTAPELPATVLARECYFNMFEGCTSLTAAPALSAKTLEMYCYYRMFADCTSLKTAPVLPAATLVYGCYDQMFCGCSNLNNVKCLATDMSADYCTEQWLNDVASTGTFTKAAGVEWPSGANGIPDGWTVVEDGAGSESFDPYSTPLTFEAIMPGTLTFYFSTGNAEYSTDGTTWKTCYSGTGITFENVGDKVSFRANDAFECFFPPSTDGGEWYLYGNVMSLVSPIDYATATELNKMAELQGLFLNNESIYNHPDKKIVLPATKLTPNCYGSMFWGCNNLTEAPELPATTLEEGCYAGMFGFTNNLTEAPELPATTLAKECYASMFQGCSNLKNVKCLASDISTESCTLQWLKDVSATGTFTKAAGVTWPTGNNGIPDGWTVVEE